MKTKLFTLFLALAASVTISAADVLFSETFSTRRASTYIDKVQLSDYTSWPYASQWFDGYTGTKGEISGNQYDNDYDAVKSYNVSVRGRKLNGSEENSVGLYFSANKEADKCYVEFEGGLPYLPSGAFLHFEICSPEADGGDLSTMVVTVNDISVNVPATTLGAKATTSIVTVALPAGQMSSLSFAFNNAPSQRFINRFWIDYESLVVSGTYQIGDLYYYLDIDNSTATVVHDDSYANLTTAIIPATVTYYNKTYTVTGIDNWAFYGCTSLVSVTILNGVTSIGNNAFNSCSNLLNVSLPNSITSVGYTAFSGCVSLNTPLYNSHLFVRMPTTYSGAYLIPNGITTIAGSAFGDCNLLSEITIPSSVTYIGSYPFNNCWSLTKITMESVTPPVIENDNLDYYGHIYVPCGSLDAYKNAWGLKYADYIQYEPRPTYTITTKAGNGGYIHTTNTIFTMCDEPLVTCTAMPDRGFRFVKWGDGVTDNPRVIELTKDITLEASFDYQLSGKCGKDNVLDWQFNPSNMALEITGKGALSENYTYNDQIESVTIGNEVTLIGQSAFYGCNKLKDIILGSQVKVLEEYAFYGCSAIETITCYSMRPPTVNNYALNGLDYTTIVYVPADYLNTYKMHDAWGLYDVRPLGAASVETAEFKVTPGETTADVVWPTVASAATYELVIKDKTGAVICTLVFNANGQLTEIAFSAPARDQAAQATGFAFTVTGLNSSTGYDLTLAAKDNNGNVLHTYTESFTTVDYETAIGLVESSAMHGGQKLLRNGQLFILRDGKTYTVHGQEVR